MIVPWGQLNPFRVGGLVGWDGPRVVSLERNNPGLDDGTPWAFMASRGVKSGGRGWFSSVNRDFDGSETLGIERPTERQFGATLRLERAGERQFGAGLRCGGAGERQFGAGEGQFGPGHGAEGWENGSFPPPYGSVGRENGSLGWQNVRRGRHCGISREFGLCFARRGGFPAGAS